MFKRVTYEMKRFPAFSENQRSQKGIDILKQGHCGKSVEFWVRQVMEQLTWP